MQPRYNGLYMSYHGFFLLPKSILFVSLRFEKLARRCRDNPNLIKIHFPSAGSPDHTLHPPQTHDVVAELLVAKVLLGAPVAAERLLAADQRQARGGPADEVRNDIEIGKLEMFPI